MTRHFIVVVVVTDVTEDIWDMDMDVIRYGYVRENVVVIDHVLVT